MADAACLPSPLTLALGGTGEGIGAWSGVMVLLYQEASWLGASVAEPCVTSKGRHDAGPVGCEAGAGYTQYLRPPTRGACHQTSYAALDRSDTPIAARGVAFLQPRRPLTVTQLFGGGSPPSTYVAQLPRDGRDGRALAAELAARNVTLALIAAAPREPSEVADAVQRPCCGVHAAGGAKAKANNRQQRRPWCNPQRYLNGWKPRARLPERHPTAGPIREFARAFVAGLAASPPSPSPSSPAARSYLVAHWRVELMDSSQARHCASWLHNATLRARAARGLPETATLVLMSDAPDASLCDGGGDEGAAGQACSGWRPDERGYNASAAYGGAEVRAALAWLKRRRWHKADETVTAAATPLLRSSHLARFLAEHEMAVDASIFVLGWVVLALLGRPAVGRGRGGGTKEGR